MLDELLMGTRFLWQLPAFLRHPVTVEEARATLKRRLENRETDFLALVKRAIYHHPPSPYRALLQLAGCEYGDLERLVRQDGVEDALGELFRHGVYLTVDEFKGRRPVVRGGARFGVDPKGLVNPELSPHLVYRSSRSRGTGTMVSVDLSYYRERAVNVALGLAARDGERWRSALWLVPGGAASLVLLPYAVLGMPPVAWFSPINPWSPEIDGRYAWSERLLRWRSGLAGTTLPRPVHVPLERSLVIARWMRACLDAGQVPHVLTFPSAAAGLCRAAREAGVSLGGAQLSVGGEPVTAARVAEIRAAGAEVLPHYGIMEVGFIGEGCLAPEMVDEIHLFQDLQAVIQAGPEAGQGALPTGALLVTSLRPGAPVVLLNVSLGDQASIGRRRCACPFETLGWQTHLHSIRSFEKLTAGGMTFLDSDLIRVLEEILPARFGGAPIDYQLVEEEDSTGRPVLRLLVHPRVGPLDEATVSEVFLEAIGAGSGADRVMSMAWRDAKLVRVQRRPPLATASGKILHLHVNGAGRTGARPLGDGTEPRRRP